MTTSFGEKIGTKALVTGGGGFLGKAITKKLLDFGIKVRIFSRGFYPELEKLGAETRNGDIADPIAVKEAAKGCDVVFHTAAKPGVWGPFEEYYKTNFIGTENVIAACQAHRIPKLIYTSSPSVIFDGKDMEDANETLPYPDHFEAHYPKTKAMAEKAILAANSKELMTVALRPHLIWGPGDNHLIPRLVKRARAGQLKIVGDGKNKIDTIFIDNAADAHILAAAKLALGSPACGKAYFITQGDPRPIEEIINGILKAAGIPPVKSYFPAKLAYFVGWGMEIVYGALGIKEEPRLTRFVAQELATAHWFNVSAAKRDLGFSPKISIEEGFKKLEEWFKINPL